MGRAKRWFRSLFGTRKNRDTKQNSSSGYSDIGVCNNPATVPPNITPAEAAWLRSFQSKSQNEQNKQVMAVATATAAVADAAMAAAQAAATVVRLAASQGKRNQFGGSREIWAAIKIQTVFRGHLARKALRALRGVVRLQAIVRGYLVRKQAAAKLHCMQALVRAQAGVLTRKICPLNNNNNNNKSQNRLSQLEARNSMDKVVNTRNEHKMSIHNRRLSASFESPKIVEVDTEKPRSRSRRTNTWMPNPGEDLFDQSITSPLPAYRFPARISIPDSRNFWGRARIECQGFFRAEVSSPRSASSCGCDVPITPVRSLCVESYFKNSVNYQNYMANTHSFEAKLRSQSAPRQRPNNSPRRRPSCPEIKERRNSLDGVRMQRSKEAPKRP